MVTDVPTGPAVGDRDDIIGVVPTAKCTVSLARPPTVITTLPVVAPLGTVATIWVSLQLIGIAGAPLNVTVLVPRELPKFIPVIVMEVPTGPTDGDKLEITGVAPTVADDGSGAISSWKVLLLLVLPPTFTTTGIGTPPPMGWLGGGFRSRLGTVTTIRVSLQIVTIPGVALKLTVLTPCEAPKFTPEIVNWVPDGPPAGDKEEMNGWVPTIKGTALLLTAGDRDYHVACGGALW